MSPADEAGAAVLEQVEPVHDVAFEELLGGVQQDLSPRHRGVHPDQVHRVLELIAEAVGAAGLVEAAPGPDAFGERLVFQPVQVAIELRLGRLDLERVHEAEPPLPRLLDGSPRGGDILVPGDDRLAWSRSSVCPRTTATVCSPPAGIVSVVSRAATGRSSTVRPASRLAGFAPSEDERDSDRVRRNRPRLVSMTSGRSDMPTKAGPVRNVLRGFSKKSAGSDRS